MQYRDGAGRTRDEQSLGGLDTSDGARLAKGRKEIEVNDVVAHCRFHWGEPWTGQDPPIATVSCFSTLYYSQWDTSWGAKAQSASESSEVGRTIKTEPLGHKIIDGLDTLGIRSIVTNSLPAKPDQPSGPPQMTLERWWSPQLNEVIRFGPVPPQWDFPLVELKDIRPGEPDPNLFYPPANYLIVKQGDPVP
jgi:hypothetical protein